MKQLTNTALWRLLRSVEVSDEGAILIRVLIALLDCELAIIDRRLLYPQLFVPPPEPIPATTTATAGAPNFDLRFVGKSKDFCIVGLAEVVYVLWLSQEIIGPDGRPVSLKRLAAAFEHFLGVQFGDIYKQVEAIMVKRKPFNRTKALDYLRTLLLREDKKRNGK